MSDELEVDSLGPAIAALKAKIAKLQSAVDALEEVRASMGFVGTSSATGSDVSFARDAFFGMTVADASKKYLAAMKRTASAKTIADALLAGGWKSASKNPSENVRTILNRNAAFAIVNGEFGLAEWYPGRKSASKAKKTPEETSASPEVEDAVELITRGGGYNEVA